ncbi:MAG: DNA-processing protein DprA [Dermatophilaceae bacterium]
MIISGLAYGIDITAHRKSNMTDVPNIGVLGHGLGSIYPKQHRSVALKMIENGGLLTEYIHSANPDREHFPMRNRIIAGMCDALVVVETAASGGSMISAQLAVDYGRDLFAVPGRINDPKSAGCNYLIQNNSARLTVIRSRYCRIHALGGKWQNAPSGRRNCCSIYRQKKRVCCNISGNNPKLPLTNCPFCPGCCRANWLRPCSGLNLKAPFAPCPANATLYRDKTFTQTAGDQTSCPVFFPHPPVANGPAGWRTPA